ncbi:hypothetical protein Arub01_34930 [Actinomadura rubrobrunea]|uniref:Uncharacterized protein n=1 Tax=Actinomadura rubrobrunea TaxID=115335 RepID=A0A9W6PVH8_9ACTN|nr:nucleic acid/nucleotide deaminase domain-containing protein [Actinomadura rubrobrunea]GLW65249.1 hypothetical protein Arub01_34930 [Actinomadura rubrobrunea]
MGKPNKGGGTTKAAGKAASGIFAKCADKLFRVPGTKRDVYRLDPKKIDSKTRDEWRKKRPSNKPGPNDKVTSRKVDPYDKNLDPKDRELIDAVKEARRQANADGGDNFAAIRFVDKDGQERILVASSDGVHSERMGANLLLDNGIDVKDIKQIYTERSPCDINPSYCDQWIKRHLPGVDVLHSFDYGINGTSRSQANSEHRKWVRSIFT